MRCSNCGSNTAYDGKVCAHCGVDKSYDKKIHDLQKMVGLGSATIVFPAIWAISGEFVPGVIGAVVVMGIGNATIAANNPAPAKRVAPTVQRMEESRTTGDTKPCPFCAETIKAAALKCRFCGSGLNR